MSESNKTIYCLNWELVSSVYDNLHDRTQGNEVIEIFIHDRSAGQPRVHYTIPIVQVGQPFALLNVNLLYEKVACAGPSNDIVANIRIYRGLERQVIYANDLILSEVQYGTPTSVHVPIYRVWYYPDYFKLVLTNFFPR